ncbi:hypothetical protein COM55_06180 [Bacillus pseudomycoides]|uniref:helix-turn-helix domain-containing protein n=1 Tax=Bacillus pseudomycoides TaxID=64104 RepID=UPI000BF246BC|nr:helix-turn-helix transcriptional regulator [Bacillus pseudomycoides]PEK65574.1 hypothetical protein CN590_18080 [Bacillus pseudomycoides]PGE87363.1 hypothetical protein COM55_06180 [Bacillus pseudomycoides]
MKTYFDLNKVCEHYGVKSNYLATLTGHHYQALDRVKRRKSARMSTITRIANALNVPAHEVFKIGSNEEGE